MRRRIRTRPTKPPAPGQPGQPADHGWKARAAALEYERPVAWAMLAAIGAMLAAMAAWTAVLIPQGGAIRFDPLFWLLAAPLLAWTGALVRFSRWAVQTLGAALLGAPALAVLALFAARRAHSARVLDGGTDLDTPLAMLVILALTLAMATAGLAALRRTSLPGGTRSPTYRVPGTRPASVPAPLPGAARGALQAGSLVLSGTLIDGMAAAIGIILFHDGTAQDPFGPAWVAAIPLAMVLAVGFLAVRGASRLVRGRPGAVADLRRGWRLGMACPVVLLLLVCAWPMATGPKTGLGLAMMPLALLGAWGGRRALRSLPAITAGWSVPGAMPPSPHA